jgi:hypothetical protein
MTHYSFYRIYIYWGLPYSKKKVSISGASRGCPPSSAATASSLDEKPPTTTSTFSILNELDSRIKLNLSNSKATA